MNCAGFNKEQRLVDVTEEAFDKAYSRALRAGVFLSQAVAAHQVLARKGNRSAFPRLDHHWIPRPRLQSLLRRKGVRPFPRDLASCT
ncbi:hypothetical protein Q3C01_44260 [Bradyrhizobium sp. UFLA05-109]